MGIPLLLKSNFFHYTRKKVEKQGEKNRNFFAVFDLFMLTLHGTNGIMIQYAAQ